MVNRTILRFKVKLLPYMGLSSPYQFYQDQHQSGRFEQYYRLLQQYCWTWDWKRNFLFPQLFDFIHWRRYCYPGCHCCFLRLNCWYFSDRFLLSTLSILSSSSNFHKGSLKRLQIYRNTDLDLFGLPYEQAKLWYKWRLRVFQELCKGQ